MVVFIHVKEEDLVKLKKIGFVAAAPRTAYEVIRYVKDSVNAIYYTSGKLFVQGKGEKVDKIASDLRRVGIGDEVKKESFRKEVGWMIGSDESLKGDTFGGIVVAAVKADDASRVKLLEIGVADSKSLSDKEVLRMAAEIRKVVACSIKNYLPEEYNKEDGVTSLLNKLHKKCADDLGNGKHVVDEYPGCNVGDIRETKAESKYLEVAAASILARSVALEQLETLSMKAGFAVPKGSTHVKLALHELQERKKDFNSFVKLHFKNVQAFLK